ncbi:uncharacterized protein LOC108741001 isoform X3 [Agrilus planipennis]|uniref:Uncharacterized protein LOC108741001 isoform X2 n=1 Tax=Agrilus planipennis TaxID=224129 RepID=A0A7F5RFN5_AGRPL|nr:uncharacterized protein LOC108741001 isoform X2 [Agrilus planipennis]XP_025834804.1 uncharacterized protein LOC108741001 isoform X3 [Agrilus planipennis]
MLPDCVTLRWMARSPVPFFLMARHLLPSSPLSLLRLVVVEYFLQRCFLRCVKPLRLRMKNILDLTHEDLPQCESEENQKQKVIIIVLSVLIAVLIIFVVYLIYLGPLYYQNKYREIGPDSPYGLVVDIQPNRVE